MLFFLNRRKKEADSSVAKRDVQSVGKVSGRDVLLGISRRPGSGSPLARVGSAYRGGTPVKRQGQSLHQDARSVEKRRFSGLFARDKRQGSLSDQVCTSQRNMRNSPYNKGENQSVEAEAPRVDGEKDVEKHGLHVFLLCLKGTLFVLLGFSLLLCVLAGVYRGSLWLYDEALTSDFFVTRHIDVTGNVRLTRDMILRIGGISEGENSFAVNISEVERRLRATPWVADVSVKRLLPDRFVIRVTERMPSFWIRVDGRLFYANDAGDPIAPVESENFMSLPLLTIEPGGEDAVPYLARLMRDMHSGILPVESGTIATIDVSPSRGVEIYLEDREMRLSLAPDDWEGNLARLGVAIGDLARRRELGRVQEVRAADGSVWVLMRQLAQ